MEEECVLKGRRIEGEVLAVIGTDEGKDSDMGTMDVSIENGLVEEGNNENELVKEVLLPALKYDDREVVLEDSGEVGDGEGFVSDKDEEMEVAIVGDMVDNLVFEEGNGSCLILDGGKQVLDGRKPVLDGRNPVLGKGMVKASSSKVVLDWKKAVMGDSGKEERRHMMGGNRIGEEVVGHEEMHGGGDDLTSSSIPRDKEAVKHVWIGNHCRGLIFDAKAATFVEEDGVTVHMDEVAASDCERRLGRALVGKILGRSVPFGFLNRDLRRKWGKFGKVQMSLIGKNCFICFFESEVIRDALVCWGSTCWS